MCKKLIGKMPSKLAYGVNAIMLLEYIMPSLHVSTPMDMMDRGDLKEGIM